MQKFQIQAKVMSEYSFTIRANSERDKQEPVTLVARLSLSSRRS